MNRPSSLESNVHRGVAAPEAGAQKSTVVRLLTDWSFAKRAVRYALHLPTPMETEDRRVLEQVIFRYYATQPEFRRILFVGCQWYTRHYGASFFPGREWWTIEPDEQARKFGGERHIVAPLQDLESHTAADYFDLIFCNGVFGFGLDAPQDCERAFAACYSRLRAGGQMLLGWNDVPARTPISLDSIASLRQFERWTFPPLGTWRYTTDTTFRHTYDFYRKSP
jgi:hypothetical protein